MKCSECGRRYRAKDKPSRDVAQMAADPDDNLCPDCQDDYARYGPKGARRVMLHYMSDDAGRTIRTTTDTLEWARWFEDAERHVGEDTVDGIRVSTVFLGVDYCLFGGPPILWETMLFAEDPDLDNLMERYDSYDDAVAGHKRWVESMVARGEEWEKAMASMGLSGL